MFGDVFACGRCSGVQMRSCDGALAVEAAAVINCSRSIQSCRCVLTLLGQLGGLGAGPCGWWKSGRW